MSARCTYSASYPQGLHQTSAHRRMPDGDRELQSLEPCKHVIEPCVWLQDGWNPPNRNFWRAEEHVVRGDRRNGPRTAEWAGGKGICQPHEGPQPAPAAPPHAPVPLQPPQQRCFVKDAPLLPHVLKLSPPTHSGHPLMPVPLRPPQQRCFVIHPPLLPHVHSI